MREMKDSGVEWIGEIPLEWEINKIKYMFSNGKGLPITKENLIDEGLPVISYGQIHSKDNNGTDIGKNLLRFVSENYSIKYPQCSISENDFVFADTSEDYDGCGNCVLKRDNSKVFAGYHTIILHSLLKRDNRFLAYLFKTDIWRKQIREKVSGVKVFSITQKTLMNCEVILPEYGEEKIIADYLDTQCSEIDATAEDIQKEISLLEDYKKSVITESVTKGLNPDAEMKDSGIAWIGEVPKHWGTIRIGNAFSIRNERNYLPMEQVQLLSLYSGKGVFPTGEEGTTNRGNHAQTVADYKIVKKNDIVVNIILAWMGSLGISNYNGVVSPAYDVYIPNEEKVVPHYYHYVFRTSGIANECYRYGRGIMMMRWRTYSSEFKRIHVPFPPLEEQQQIADFLDSKCSEIDAIIADKKRQRGILAEYKKSLIYEYVTGKKEVPVHE